MIFVTSYNLSGTSIREVDETKTRDNEIGKEDTAIGVMSRRRGSE